VKGQHGLSFLQGPETENLRLKRVSAAVKYGEVGGLAAPVSAVGRVLAGACKHCMVGWVADVSQLHAASRQCLPAVRLKLANLGTMYMQHARPLCAACTSC
jgi:hypothetical protein